MYLDHYQRRARKFYAVVPDVDPRLYGAMLLAAEAGEVANLTQKLMRGDFDGYSDAELLKVQTAMLYELGDAQWGVAITAAAWGYDLSHVARHNLRKLQRRFDTHTIKGGIRNA